MIAYRAEFGDRLYHSAINIQLKMSGYLGEMPENTVFIIEFLTMFLINRMEQEIVSLWFGMAADQNRSHSIDEEARVGITRPHVKSVLDNLMRTPLWNSKS
jgi:hypothetical protein